METILWIIVAVIVVGLIVWYLKSKGQGPTQGTPPQTPSTPPPGTPGV